MEGKPSPNGRELGQGRQPAYMSDFSSLGFKFDPFEHLDSAKDIRLQEYLVIPKAVQITLSDQPVGIFAQPGGGKSALRIYTSRFYGDSRGLKFPITYIPATYSTDTNLHYEGIRGSLARAVFMYLVSYPDLFFTLPHQITQKIKQVLLDIPYGLEFHLSGLTLGRFITDIEQLLGVSALSGIQILDRAHQQMAQELMDESFADSRRIPLEEGFGLLKDAFGVKSVHILVDGLDGFIETKSDLALISWIEPLLKVVKQWERKNIYLKFFLPMDISDFPLLRNLRTAALEWDDGLLAEVIRRRVFVASGGAFDSLDAVSAPDVRNVELNLARQLGEKQKLPRQIILKSHNLLKQVVASQNGRIVANDIFARELSYAVL
jgi:hypothetical protein